jgi:hypothetical protein
VTTDVTLAPTSLALGNVVVTGAASGRAAGERKEASARAPGAGTSSTPTPSPAPASAPTNAARFGASPPAYGCYELGITPSSTQSRSGFRQVPRRISLDSALVPARADGPWYQVRDLGGSGAANGVWRPLGTDGIEAQWTYGSRMATLRLTGQGGSVLRGSVEEIDRATVTGEAGTVVAIKRSCGGG